MERTTAQVDQGLLTRRTDQLLCSRCLKTGIRRRVVQIISARHRLQSLCRSCRQATDATATRRSPVHRLGCDH
jgi:hypothetical protein